MVEITKMRGKGEDRYETMSYTSSGHRRLVPEIAAQTSAFHCRLVDQSIRFAHTRPTVDEGMARKFQQLYV